MDAGCARLGNALKPVSKAADSRETLCRRLSIF